MKSQSTNYYSDNLRSLPVLMKWSLSIAAADPKAQQEPHAP